jgi:hypothetical protein
MRHSVIFFTVVLAILQAAHAQTPAPIERIKITDNDLTCQQIFEERNSMDLAVVEAKNAQASGETTAVAGQAAEVAAEVANRTGMFGSLGSVAGQLLGNVASKSAASATTQMGQQDAAQAAARERQALARKDQLTQLFLAKGCSASDPSAAPKNPNAAVPLPASPLAAKMASAEPSVATLSGARSTPLAMKIEVINPEDLLDSGKVLVVPTAYVTLLTDGRVSAAKQTSALQSGSATARASASYRVSGIDKAYAQLLAKAAYDDLISQLRQAGYTVLTYADVKDRDFIRAAGREPAASLPTKSEGGNNFVTAAPSDEQHFASGTFGGIFSEFTSGGKSKFTDATLIIPQYTFTSPQSWAESSSGYKSVSAEANVAPGMNLLTGRVYWIGQPRSRMMTGIPGVGTKQQVINVTEKAGALEKTADTTPTTANALSGLFNSLSGAGNIQKTSSEYLFTIDRDAYAGGIMNGVHNFNAEVARAAASAKP